MEGIVLLKNKIYERVVNTLTEFLPHGDHRTSVCRSGVVWPLPFLQKAGVDISLIQWIWFCNFYNLHNVLTPFSLHLESSSQQEHNCEWITAVSAFGRVAQSLQPSIVSTSARSLSAMFTTWYLHKKIYFSVLSRRRWMFARKHFLLSSVMCTCLISEMLTKDLSRRRQCIQQLA
jgi:hypothetical protein